MVNYQEAFKRPFQDIKKLLIGIVLYFIPIVNFFAVGYQLNCAKSALKKDYKLPEWKNWGDLFVKGLLSFIIGVIYSIPLIIVAMFVIGTAVLSIISAIFSGSAESIVALLTGMGAGLALLIIIALLTAFIAPMAVVSYATNFNFGDAFNFGTVFKKAFSGKYFAAWILMLLYGAVLGGILSFIPFIGTAIAGFIVGLTTYTAFGEVYSETK